MSTHLPGDEHAAALARRAQAPVMSRGAAAVARLDAERRRGRRARTLPRDDGFWRALADSVLTHGRVHLDLAGQTVAAETRPHSPAWHRQQAHDAGVTLMLRLTAAPQLALPPGPIGRTRMLADLLDGLDM